MVISINDILVLTDDFRKITPIQYLVKILEDFTILITFSFSIKMFNSDTIIVEHQFIDKKYLLKYNFGEDVDSYIHNVKMNIPFSPFLNNTKFLISQSSGIQKFHDEFLRQLHCIVNEEIDIKNYKEFHQFFDKRNEIAKLWSNQDKIPLIITKTNTL